MDETLVSELESAIADTGALLVRAQKYRRGAGPEGAALAREALALGDAARRLHRQDALDAAAAARLLAEARALAERLRALVAAVLAAPDYHAAVAAHAEGAHATLGPLLPRIFARLEPAGNLGDLYAPLAWLRRGRLRAAEDVVADVVEARDVGLAGEGDDLSPGADAQLPAVVLSEVLSDEPVALRLPAGSIAAPAHRLAESDEVLVHAARLPVRARVLLARELALDEQLRVEITPADYARYREVLAAALAAAGIPVDER